MIIKVTDVIKNGEIVLPTIGCAVKAGIELTISDEDFYNNDIQIGIRKGFLVISDKQGHNNSPFAKKIAITNLTGRPLALDAISLLIGETTNISEREYNSTNVQTAINAGMIEAELPQNPQQIQQETEDNEDYEEDPSPRRIPVKKGQSVRVEDVRRLLEKSNEKQASSQKRSVPTLLNRNTTVSKNSLLKAPVDTTKYKPQKNVNNEDKISRLERIAEKIEVGGKVSRQSFRYEDPIDRLTKIAQEIEQSQNDNARQYEDPDTNFIDENTDQREGEREDNEEMRERIDEARNAASGTKMSAWNPHSKQMMGRRESSNKVAKIVDSRAKNKRSVNEDDIMVGDIDFSDEGVSSAKKTNSSPLKKGKEKRPGLQPVGRQRIAGDEEGDMDFIDARDHDEIIFVDREQTQQRIRSRPDIMRRRANNAEIM